MTAGARLLHVHRYYAPDAPPYATMLRVIATHLANEGYDVHVVSSLPTYNDASSQFDAPRRAVEDGVHVHRVTLPIEDKAKPVQRAVIALLFIGAVFVEVLRVRPRLVTFSTMPPVVLGLAVRLALFLIGRRGQFLYHCQDLYPEASTAGNDAPPTLLYRLLSWAEASTRRAAAAVVVLSEDMKRTVVRGGARPSAVHVANNFSLIESTSTRPTAAGRPPRVVFAGNLGRFQMLDVVADAVRIVRATSPDIEFLFLGDGVARAAVASLEGPNVELRGYVPPDAAFKALQRCDVGLVTLKPGMLDVAYPSKTMTYLAAGCTVVAMADLGSDLCRTLEDEGVGRAVASGDAAALAAAIAGAVADEDGAGPHKAQAAAERLFGRASVLDRWSEIVKQTLEAHHG